MVEFYQVEGVCPASRRQLGYVSFSKVRIATMDLHTSSEIGHSVRSVVEFIAEDNFEVRTPSPYLAQQALCLIHRLYEESPHGQGLKLYTL